MLIVYLCGLGNTIAHLLSSFLPSSVVGGFVPEHQSLFLAVLLVQAVVVTVVDGAVAVLS